MSRLKNIFWIFIEKFGLIVFSFATFYIFAKYLAVKEYGLGVLSIAIIEFVGVFFVGLWNDPLVRRESLVLESYSAVFWLGGGAVVIIMPLFNIAVLLITENSELALLTSIASIKVLAVVLARPFVAQLRRDRNFKLLAVRTLIGKILGAITGIIMAVRGFGALAVVSQIVVMEILALFIMLWGKAELVRTKVEFSVFLSISREGGPIAVRQLLSSSMVRGTILVMGFTTSTTMIGYFSFANRLIELPFGAISTGVRSYVLPVLAKRSQQEQSIGPLTSQLSFATAFFLFPVFIFVSILAPPFITLFFDGKWDSAIPLFQGIALLGGLKLFVLYHGIALVALGKSKIGIWLEIINVGVSLLLIYFLTLEYGLQGVVIALSAHLIFDIIIKVYSLKKAIDYPVISYLKNLFKMLISGLVLVYSLIQSLLFFDSGIYQSTIIAFLVGAATYILSLVFLRFDSNKSIRLVLIK